ncbi:hypothetical protein EZV62_001805 [Acer yangbiense]|uniref:Uncharacterized protein n=1 Tax=Acer yangbiense TaxID=1000413 RepID=A0A5C7IXQ3_9ROSI|nr:hypothetical protein EZV62_001805 [Acer yangbiense]
MDEAEPNNHDMEGQQRPNDHNNGGKISCQIYRKHNHHAVDCWYRFNYSYQLEDFPYNLATLALNDTNDHSFIVDSSATSHMTNDAGNLSDIGPYYGNDAIYVGDENCLPITHTCETCLQPMMGK